jgi:RimJ/RimL family protein N-acetyltransferase
MFYSQRLRLRAVEREDLPRFVSWLNDPEVRNHLALYLPLSLAAEERWFEKELAGPGDEQPLVIEVKDGTSWLPAGGCGFKGIDWRNRSAGLGIFIGDRANWGQGYGTEAVRVLLEHGFGTLNLHRVWLEVYETNRRAIPSYEKAGFVAEGCKRQAVFKGGKYDNVILMSVLRPEWQARPAT